MSASAIRRAAIISREYILVLVSSTGLIYLVDEISFFF